MQVTAVASFCLNCVPCYSHLKIRRHNEKRGLRVRTQHQDDDASAGDASSDLDSGSSYQSSASLTKGIVSSLTSLTNSIISQSDDELEKTTPAYSSSRGKPTSPQELLSRIRNEYTQNNYLWTGNLDTSSFVANCTFTDPTLSFVGVDKYIENVGNLVPVVDYLLGEENPISRSDLLDISLNEEEKYIETRWNMVGELNRLLWKPKIDVIGRTKFWYQEEEVGEGGRESKTTAFQVYFYDEMWEIPAGLALLQLVTKAGTIANTAEK